MSDWFGRAQPGRGGEVPNADLDRLDAGDMFEPFSKGTGEDARPTWKGQYSSITAEGSEDRICERTDRARRKVSAVRGESDRRSAQGTGS